MRVARDLGRPVQEIWRQSFALTLYVAWQLQQLERRDQFLRQLEQHELASLIAFSFNEPKRLPDVREDFVNSFTNMKAMDARRERLERARALVARHAAMKPVAPKPGDPGYDDYVAAQAKEGA